MAKAVVLTPRNDGPPPIPPQPVVEQTVTTKTTGPAASLLPPPPAAKAPKPHINEWFAKLDPEYRMNHCAYYLYRLDPNIVIVNPDLEGRANGGMLDRLTPSVIGSLSADNFLGELQVWTKDNYGGGNFEIKVTDNKMHKIEYDLGFKVEGAPKLSSREAYTAGGGPAGPIGPDQNMITWAIRQLEDKIAALANGRQDPSATMATVMSTILDSQNKSFQWAMDRQPKGSEPAQQLEQMKAMFDMFKGLYEQRTAAAPQKSTIEQLQEIRGILQLAREMEGTKDSAALTPATLKEAFIEAAKTLVSSRSGRGSDMSGWVELAKALSPALAPLGLIIAQKLQGTSTPRPAASVRIQPPGIAPSAQPPASLPTSQAVRPGVNAPFAPVAAAPNPPGNSAAPQPTNTYETVISPEEYEAVLWDHCRKQLIDMLTHDVAGDDAAFVIHKSYPQYAVRMSMATPEILNQQIAIDPMLSQVKDDPRLPAFLAAFLRYFQGGPEGEEEEQEDNRPN